MVKEYNYWKKNSKIVSFQFKWLRVSFELKLLYCFLLGFSKMKGFCPQCRTKSKEMKIYIKCKNSVDLCKSVIDWRMVKKRHWIPYIIGNTWNKFARDILIILWFMSIPNSSGFSKNAITIFHFFLFAYNRSKSRFFKLLQIPVTCYSIISILILKGSTTWKCNTNKVKNK